MKKLTVKNLIEFREKSEKSKKNFAISIKNNKEQIKSKKGGDYWISSLSAISNSFKSNDVLPIYNKKEELEDKLNTTTYKRTIDMYKRNIDILYNFGDKDLKKIRPKSSINFLKKDKKKSVLNVNGLEVEASPNYVFTFKNNDEVEVGAIWFIAKLNGFNPIEIGLFAEMLYTYLEVNYSNQYKLNPNYCIAVDVTNNISINFSQLENGEVPLILNITINEIKKYL